MRLWILLLLAVGAAAPARAEEPSIGLDEIRAGQRGHGVSVFAGNASERFEVEVLGVIREASPGLSYVLARLSGHDLERTGVVGGMSGSPVWIDGRLAGAVAFSWPFSQEAIAGITPIGSMRAISATAPWARGPGAPTVTWNDLATRRWPEDLPRRAAAALGGGPRPGAASGVVWSAAGFEPTTLAWLSDLAPQLAVASAGSAAAAAGEIGAGSSIAAVFIDGDFRLAATGTVTERSGDRVLAFGHPVAGGGELRLPMAAAEVVAVLGSQMSSFKLANVGPIVGAFERDHASGMMGTLGAPPPTVGLEVTVAAPLRRDYHMRLARVPDFLPSLASIGSFAALDAATAIGGIQAVDLGLELDLGADGKLRLAQSFDGPLAAERGLAFLVAVVDFVVRTDLAPVELIGLAVEWTPFDRPRAAEVIGAHAARPRLGPGDTAELIVEARGYRGDVERRTVELVVPSELPAGRYTLLLGDAATLDGVRLSIEPQEPRSFAQALALLGTLGSSRELAVLGLGFEPGVASGGGALPRLPPSVRALWAAAAPSERGLRSAIVQRLSWPSAVPLSGVARVDLEIERPLAVPAEAESAGAARRSPPRTNGRGGPA